MKTRFLAMLSLLVASSSFAQLPYTQEQVIAYAKSIDVHTLDPSLPSQRLEEQITSARQIFDPQKFRHLRPGS